MVPLAAPLRPPLDLDTALTAHVPDAAGLVLVALLAFGYLAAVRAVVRTGHPWPARRTMSCLLLLVVPALLALGRPTLLVRTLQEARAVRRESDARRRRGCSRRLPTRWSLRLWCRAPSVSSSSPLCCR